MDAWRCWGENLGWVQSYPSNSCSVSDTQSISFKPSILEWVVTWSEEHINFLTGYRQIQCSALPNCKDLRAHKTGWIQTHAYAAITVSSLQSPVSQRALRYLFWGMTCYFPWTEDQRKDGILNTWGWEKKKETSAYAQGTRDNGALLWEDRGVLVPWCAPLLEGVPICNGEERGCFLKLRKHTQRLCWHWEGRADIMPREWGIGRQEQGL